jgi:prepilin-type N-terminal cleavage/methylation domain-containing protein
MLPETINRNQRGTSLAELMIALVVLAVGLLAVAQTFPAGSRGQVQDRMLTAANFYAQEKLESLANVSYTDPLLSAGTHATEDLGPWKRRYTVAQMAAPLDNLKCITVTVTWTLSGRTRTVTTTTYLRR